MNVQDKAYQYYGSLVPFVKDQLRFALNNLTATAQSLKPRLKRVPVDSLVPVQSGTNYWNEYSKKQAEEFNLIDNGSKEVISKVKLSNFNPILVDINTNRILDGHHRHAALSSIKAPYAVVLYVDYNIPIRDAEPTSIDYQTEE